MSEDPFIRAKKMEIDNKIAKLDRDKSIFEGITWKDLIFLAASIIAQIVGGLIIEYFFSGLSNNMWFIIGALLIITIIMFCYFEYFKNKHLNRVRPKH